MKYLLIRFLRDDSAATAIEYGLIAGGIAVIILTAVRLIGTNLNPTFASVAADVLAP
jgi:pilus assembly protein Flp/PilA